MRWPLLLSLLLLPAPALAQPKAGRPNPGNRLAYLDELDPYYPTRHFPKLITPQWVGEDGVDAVVVLAIDDMRDPKPYEAYLRPILRRLKAIDGRAPVSIMTCSVDPKHPQLQTWLKEGLSLECHTVDHPCPFFRNGFDRAKDTYDRCIDLLHQVPGNRPVAFRMPCCDSLNTPSPRFWAEVFSKTTAKGHSLSLDSSVFNVFTADDPELPKELVRDADGRDRFRKYLPPDRSFVNTIENYPYPYVIGNQCWQFPCMTPSDWQAQHLHRPNSPVTVKDWQAALDCTVIKKGVCCLVFHPHGWIKNEQVVELIDHAVAKHGKKVKFLTFKEAHDRLEKHLLAGEPWTIPAAGNQFRILDVDHDGYVDVVATTPRGRKTRLWSPADRRWREIDFPAPVGAGLFSRGQFGVFRPDGRASFLSRQVLMMGINRMSQHAWHYDGKGWQADPAMRDNRSGAEAGPVEVLLRDVDGDGVCEVIEPGRAVLGFDSVAKRWQARWKWSLPRPRPNPLAIGRPGEWGDTGFRYRDLDGDGKLDVVFSTEAEYGLYLYAGPEKGWAREILAGKRGDKAALPMISRHGTDNGFFIHSGHLWWSNEDTALLKDHVDRRSIMELLARK